MTNSFRSRAGAAILGIVFSAGAGLAGDRVAGGRASGTFESPNWKLPVNDAYAFHGKGGLDEEEKILVAVTNASLNAEAIDATYDRRYVLSDAFSTEKTKIVFFEFGLDGRYEGYSFYFGSGDGCGYCGGGPVRSTVRLKNGRLQGKLHLDEKDERQKFDVELDVPVATDDHGAKQGPGGGEPGKAYEGYHRANVSGDRQEIRRHCSARMIREWDDARKEHREKGYVEFITGNRPKTVRVTEAFVKGDRAIVLVSGESPILGKMHGEASLVREGGQWKLEDETLQLGE